MLRFFFKILFRFVFILVLIGGAWAWIFDVIYRADGYHGPVSDHFDGKRFSNISTPNQEKESLKEKWSEITDWLTTTRPLWVPRNVDPALPERYYTWTGIKVTAVGHASFLIQVNGLNILTDPIWTDSPSPFQSLSHGRYTNPGILFSDLPPIDAVLISHNHYDHLDLPTLGALHERDHPLIYTWLGNSEFLKKNNIESSRDLDWFDTISLTGVSITFVPADHYSARAISDRRTTLWWGFVIEWGGKSLYFAWDTASWAFVDAIRAKYPNGFDIWLLPIGAYRPEYIMKDKHMNPRESLTLAKELKIRAALGMHWGTFALGSDGQDEPVKDLELAKKDFSPQVFEPAIAGKEWVFE